MLHLLLGFFWFVSMVKAKLFWLYLWQLKEYHAGRFLDHFRTFKGKSIFLSLSFASRALLLFSLPFVLAAVGVLILLYIVESANIFRHTLNSTLLRPVFTKKMLFLASTGILLLAVFLFVLLKSGMELQSIAFWMVLFDVASPLLFSSLVLLVQPFAVVGRTIVIEKARKKRATLKNLKVVGITGSYGKTSTKEFLFAILSKRFKVVKTPLHRNSEIGISQTILEDIKPEHEVFVCEMGAYNRGGIRLLASIAKPEIGILTGINEQHMATFGSQENIVQAKYELIESLPPNGVAFFNAKNSYCVALYEKTSIRKVLYGQAARFRGEENILGAMAVAKELGMSDEEISTAIKGIDPIFPGTKIKKGKNRITVIDATYSANPDGVIANLEYLKTFSGKKIIVMPCLIELGRSSKEVHRRIGKKIAEVCDFAIITTRDRLEDIKEGAGGQKILFLENPEKIVEQIKSTTTTGDVVLLEGRVPSEVTSLLQGLAQKPGGKQAW